ncbi:MAG: hypothetical protein KY467_03080 [Gemmatimonadetes bacterium]|nr:hypothetical protein [Gemmatimonadota bacterium]
MPLTRLRRLTAAGLACAALLAAPTALAAQTTVRPGAYVRILAPSLADSLLAGMVLVIDSASLLLSPSTSGGSRTVALRDIERLEVRGPGAPRTLTGALWGLAAGAVAGYAICHVASASPHRNCPWLKGTFTGGVVGLVLGAEVGMRVPGPYRWHAAVAPRP